MATLVKFNSFVEALAEKVHNLGSDSLKIALTNTLPSASNTVLANISEVNYSFLSLRTLTTVSSAQTSGVYKLVLSDLILLSSGGSTGPFRYVVFYNDTATNKELIAYVDNGTITLSDGDSLTIDLDGTNGFMQLT